MTAQWPATLPKVSLRDGYTRELDFGVTYSARDVGPPLARRRFTRPRLRWTHRMRLSAEQLDAFRAWVDSELDGGTAAFEFYHPELGTPLLARLTAPPRYEGMRGIWHFVTLELEAVEV